MKKSFLVILLIISSLSGFPQVTFDTCRLSDALVKAKKENKMVMLFFTAPWCGPCKKIIREYFPTKEATDFINPRMICLKYEAGVDNFADVMSYKINANPTLIFLNGEGKEVSRMVGGAGDLQSFMERLRETLLPENSHAQRLKRFESDPSYAVEYFTYLNNSQRAGDAVEALTKFFNRSTPQQKFTKECVQYYRYHCKNFQHEIIQYMLNNRPEVESIMGKDAYAKFLGEKADEYINTSYVATKYDNLSTVMEVVAKHDFLKTSYYNFVEEVVKNSARMKYRESLPIAYKYIKDADSQGRKLIVHSILCCSQEKKGGYIDKEGLLKFMSESLSYEKDKDIYDIILKQRMFVENPESLYQKGR